MTSLQAPPSTPDDSRDTPRDASRDLSRDLSRDALRVAIIGNPNTGKTTLFNALTGLRQRVGNFAGVTV